MRTLLRLILKFEPQPKGIQIDKTTAELYNVTVVTLYNSLELDINMQKWLLLTYKIPQEPSARRVYIWRKLKRIGALPHQDSCWILPHNARTREQFQWLTVEIIENGGEATLWETSLVLGTADETLKQKFIEQVNQPYLEIIEKLEHGEADLESLSRLYQQILSKDYFSSNTGSRLREALLSMRGDES